MSYPFRAADLRAADPVKVSEALSKLSKKQLEELLHDYKFWARDAQLQPPGKWWNIWFINAGRGFGKTWTGVQWVRDLVKKGKKRIAAVAATNSDIERVMVKGDSGFLNLCSKHDKTYNGVELGMPEWSPTKRTLTWANGAKVEFYSAQEPERLRGPQFEAAWCDELAAWMYDEDTWDMLQFCLRLGKHPRICITTTPKPTKLVRDILKGSEDQYDTDGVLVRKKTVVVTSGSTYENADNLASTYLKAVEEQYEGTRLGRQELYAEVLMESEGALWTADMIDNCQVSRDEVPELIRKVVSIDPAVTANVESDMTGIVVAGIDINGIVYILGDYTFKGLPEAWAKKAIDLYHDFGCSRIVYESNQGKALIPTVMRVIDPEIPLKGVHASDAKIARAEPVSSLYERNKVKHVRNPENPDSKLNELEVQMTTFEPLGKHKSPDRYDAMVWAVTELALKGYSAPKLQLIHRNKNDLGDS